MARNCRRRAALFGRRDGAWGIPVNKGRKARLRLAEPANSIDARRSSCRRNYPVLLVDLPHALGRSDSHRIYDTHDHVLTQRAVP